MDRSPQARYNTQASNASTKSTDSDGDLPPLLRDYFDKSGDLMILRARLEDLDLQEAEELSQRELLQDQDQAPLKTEQQFAKQYSDLRGQLLQRARDLQTEIDILRSSVDSDGLDVDQAKWRTSRPFTSASPSIATSVPLSTSATDYSATLSTISLGEQPFSASATSYSSTQSVVSLSEQPSSGISSQTGQQNTLDLVSRFQRLRPASAWARSLPPIPDQTEDIHSTSVQRLERPEFAPANGRNISDVDANATTSHRRHRSSFTAHALSHEAVGASKSTPTLLPSSRARHGQKASSSSASSNPFPAHMKRGASLPEDGVSSLPFSTQDHSKWIRRGIDPATGTQFDLEYGPPDNITDPELRKAYGVYARKRVGGTSGEVETLDSSFHVPSQPLKFFRQGKVFAILWAEPNIEGGDPVTEITSNELSTGVYARVRRFVVIRAMQDYCSAIPIATNHGRGTSGEKKSDFAVVHTSKVPPDILPEERAIVRGESGMRSMSIRIEPDDKLFSLDPLSRLNFGKVYTVDYSVKVKSIGMVHRASMRHLLYQFRDVWKPAFTPAAPVNLPEPSPVAIRRTEQLPAQSPIEPPRPHQLAKENAELDNNKGRRLPQKNEEITSSPLIRGASGAVDALLSRGHSVDQILSAIGTKTYLRDQSHDLDLNDGY